MSFARNKLRSLPTDISACSILRSLDLTCNQILKLPSSCSKLTTLTALWIGRNKIKEISPGLATLRNLAHVGLEWNYLRQLPHGLLTSSGWGQLQTLDLEHNMLEDLGQVDLSIAAYQNPECDDRRNLVQGDSLEQH